MTIDTNKIVSITEAGENPDIIASDEEVLNISQKLIAQNKEAYEVLAQ